MLTNPSTTKKVSWSMMKANQMRIVKTHLMVFSMHTY